MGRKPTKCPKKCPNHLLSIKAIHSNTYICREVSVSFCPPSLKEHPIYPVFNRDRKHYSSSFILHSEKQKYEKNDALYKAEHHRFCQEQLDGKSVMFKPKPRSKNQYCHVCRQHYDDYLEHIQTFSHKQSTRKNKFSQHISSLVEQKFPKKKEEEYNSFSLPLEELILEKEVSLSTIPSSYGQTVNQPKVGEQFKKFGTGRRFGPELQENGRSMPAKIVEMKERNNEQEGKIFLSPEIIEKNEIVGGKKIILNTFVIPE